MSLLSIALVRQRYTADGGAERFVARLLNAMQGHALRVTLITRAWQPTGGVEALTVNPFYIGRLWRDWSYARAVCRAIKRSNFHLVQSHERIACCDIYRAGDGVHREWLAQRRRTLGPIGRFGQWLNPYHRYVLKAERRLFESRRLRAVICNSDMIKAEVQHYFGLAEERLHVIRNGVDLERFHPSVSRYREEVRARYGVGVNAPLFLFVGSGFERKGLTVVLRALAGLAGTHLLVVGRDKKQKTFRALARALGIEQRVHFAGTQTDVLPYYGAADALVLPTLYDPFPNVAIEAMACGLPIITSTKCGAAELIRADENGYVTDALDIAGVSAAMQRLVEPARRTMMGAAARRTVESLDMARTAEQLVAVYRSCL